MGESGYSPNRVLSPFISPVSVVVPLSYLYKPLSNASFEIDKRPGTYAKTVKASYSATHPKLRYDGYTLEMPVFGLYDNYLNKIKITMNFADGGSYVKYLTIQTPAYTPDNSKRDPLKIVKPATQELDYSFMMLENNRSRDGKWADRGPEIYDIDGYVRWARPDIQGKSHGLMHSLYQDGKILVYMFNPGNEIAVLPLFEDKQLDTFPLILPPDLTNVKPHHEVAVGKESGQYLLNIDAHKNGIKILESILLEVDEQGNVLKRWDFGEILGNYIKNNGSNTEKANMNTDFIRDGVDWFHMNSAIYSPKDNSIIVSSRELFIIKIDYDTKEIKWLFGDKDKHWYKNYPSLHDLVIEVEGAGEVPIGQHALSLPTIDDYEALSFFNNGAKSVYHHSGTAPGRDLSKSLAQTYRIDDITRKAKLLWEYDAGLYSRYCSSVYKQERDRLITYSSVDQNGKKVVVKGVRDQTELFSFELPKGQCNPWNIEIARLHDLRF